ncbi:hypothetical protein N0V88_003631 [Collariella sp. IMI 366227]|nr:hypothetical protein N0V88_003631 [Collariella sp. IMI 366227]
MANRNYPALVQDLYKEDPEFPSWDQRDEGGGSYEPWFEENDERILKLVYNITRPPCHGLLNRIDPNLSRLGSILKRFKSPSDKPLTDFMQEILEEYDKKMTSYGNALCSLVGAHKSIHRQRGANKVLEDLLEEAHKEISECNKTIESQEVEKAADAQKINELKKNNQLLARSEVQLQKKYDKLVEDQGTQLAALEGMIANWNSLATVSTSRRTNHGSVEDFDGRFNIIIDTLDQARVSAARSTNRLKQLKQDHRKLEESYEDLTSRPRSQRMSLRSTQTSIERHAEELEEQVDRLQTQIQDYKERLDKQHKHHEREIAKFLSDHDKAFKMHRMEVDGVLIAVANEKEKAINARRGYDELRKRFQNQVVEASENKERYENIIRALEKEYGELRTQLDDVMARREADTTARFDADGDPGSPSRDVQDEQGRGEQVENQQPPTLESPKSLDSLDIPESPQSRHIHSPQSPQSQPAQSPRSLQAHSKLMKEYPGIRRVLEEPVAALKHLEEVSAKLDAQLEEEVEGLRQQVRSDDQIFREIKESVRQQSAKLEAARTSLQLSYRSDIPSSVLRGDFTEPFEPSLDAKFGASELEIKCLQDAIGIIKDLRTRAVEAINEKGINGGADAVAEVCIENLTPVIEGLQEAQPDAAAGLFITDLQTCLERSVRMKIEGDKVGFYMELDQHDRHLKNMLYLARATSSDFGRDRKVLDDISGSLDALERVKETQGRLMWECQDYRARHPAPSLEPKQSQEVVRLASNFVEATGALRTHHTPNAEQAAVERLVDRIQDVTGETYLKDRQRELQVTIQSQMASVEEVERKISKAMDLIREAKERLSTLDRFKTLESARCNRGKGREADANERHLFICAFERHEEKLDREMKFHKAVTERARTAADRAEEFLRAEVATDHQCAEKLLTQTLLKFRGPGAAASHLSSACFCTLLRHFLPSVYYATLSGACCTGTKPPARNSPNPSSTSRGHHGHGRLLTSASLYTTICTILTSLTWLLLLVFIQPYNLYTTAACLFTLLAGFPRYLARLAGYTAHRVREWRFLRRNPHLRGIQRPQHIRRTMPRLETPRLPRAGTVAGAAVTAFLLYAWLAYIAVLVERRIWTGGNDWRWAYVVDLTTAGRQPPYSGWSPFEVDWRLVGPGRVLAELLEWKDWFVEVWMRVVHELFYGRSGGLGCSMGRGLS